MLKSPRLPPMPPKSRVIRDPIYGYIDLPGKLAVLVDHPLFQRLRRINQTSLTSAVYPTATGTRFEHGLGAMHLAMRGFRAAWSNARDEVVRQRFLDAVIGDEEIHATRAELADRQALVGLIEVAVGGAALLHDLGHPPFSHVLEPVYELMAAEHFAGNPEVLQQWQDSGRPYHEFAGHMLLQQILRDLTPDILAQLIRRILHSDENSGTWAGVLHAIIAGEVDVDRLDYVMRDAQKAGTEFGAIDYSRLIEALELHYRDGSFRIAPGLRARSAVETLLLQRTQAYKWITFHPRVVGANSALARAVGLFRKLASSDETFGSAENRRTASSVFGPQWPDLNYLEPAERDLRHRLGMDGEESQGAGSQLELDEQQLRGLVADLRQNMQAAVDDSTVIEALKSAGLLAETLLTSGEPTKDLTTLLIRFLTFQQHALLRAKNCLPAWKTVDEFDSAADEMRDEMAGAVRESYEEVSAASDFAKTSAAEVLEDECRELEDLILGDPPIGVNRVITSIFDGERRYQEQFARELGVLRGSLEGSAGTWEVAYTGFTSVKKGDGAAVLFDGPAERPLYESSKLAQALANVEAARPRLIVFFFVNYPGRFSSGNDADSKEMRQKLTGDVVHELPKFVRAVLPTVIRESFEESSPTKGGGE
jgi:HD superfamily phosphohydrolase